MLFKIFIVYIPQPLDLLISSPSPSYPSPNHSRNQTFIKQRLGRMEKSRLTLGLTSEPKSPSLKSMNPRTTNLMMDGELSLSTTGILHSLNPPNHENHRHHHPLTMKINLNPNAHSRNLPIPRLPLPLRKSILVLLRTARRTDPKSRPHSFTSFPSQQCPKRHFKLV